VIIYLIVHLTIGLNWVTKIMGLLSIPVKLRWYQYMSNIENGPSCPPMSKMAWYQLSTLEKLDGTSCPPWHNWMVPVVHLCQKWHGTSCPWYQLSGSLYLLSNAVNFSIIIISKCIHFGRHAFKYCFISNPSLIPTPSQCDAVAQWTKCSSRTRVHPRLGAGMVGEKTHRYNVH